MDQVLNQLDFQRQTKPPTKPTRHTLTTHRNFRIVDKDRQTRPVRPQAVQSFPARLAKFRIGQFGIALFSHRGNVPTQQGIGGSNLRRASRVPQSLAAGAIQLANPRESPKSLINKPVPAPRPTGRPPSQGGGLIEPFGGYRIGNCPPAPIRASTHPVSSPLNVAVCGRATVMSQTPVAVRAASIDLSWTGDGATAEVSDKSTYIDAFPCFSFPTHFQATTMNALRVTNPAVGTNRV